MSLFSNRPLVTLKTKPPTLDPTSNSKSGGGVYAKGRPPNSRIGTPIRYPLISETPISSRDSVQVEP